MISFYGCIKANDFQTEMLEKSRLNEHAWLPLPMIWGGQGCHQNISTKNIHISVIMKDNGIDLFTHKYIEHNTNIPDFMNS